MTSAQAWLKIIAAQSALSAVAEAPTGAQITAVNTKITELQSAVPLATDTTTNTVTGLAWLGGSAFLGYWLGGKLKSFTSNAKTRRAGSSTSNMSGLSRSRDIQFIFT